MGVFLRIRRRPGRLRLLAVLATLVFNGGWATDVFAHEECAHHSLEAAARHDTPADHGSHLTDHSHGSRSEESSEGHPCTCIGACLTADLAISAGPDAPELEIRPTSSNRVTPWFDRAPSVRWPPFTLPFANAPPLG